MASVEKTRAENLVESRGEVQPDALRLENQAESARLPASTINYLIDRSPNSSPRLSNGGVT